MVEYSIGYQTRAKERLEQLEKTLTPQARAVARDLSQDFEKSSTKQDVNIPNRDQAA
jgi:hypothetical protein